MPVRTRRPVPLGHFKNIEKCLSTNPLHAVEVHPAADTLQPKPQRIGVLSRGLGFGSSEFR